MCGSAPEVVVRLRSAKIEQMRLSVGYLWASLPPSVGQLARFGVSTVRVERVFDACEVLFLVAVEALGIDVE